MSRVDAVLASFKQGQRNALKLQAEARQERENKLAKAAAGAGRGRGKAAPRAGKSASAASGDASNSIVASAGGAPADWRQRSRTGQQAVPLGVKLKAVVDFLRAAGEPQPAPAIAAATGFDPAADTKLQQALASNSKVAPQPDGLYAYVPEVANVRSKREVLDYMLRRERQREGYAALGELQDAYPGVAADLAELKQEGLVLALPAADPSRKEVYFPVDQRLHLRVDPDLQDLWLGISIPEDEDEVQAELLKIGIKPAPRQVLEKRVAREKKKKARKQRQLRKVTNLHLKHLLEGDAPINIETA